VGSGAPYSNGKVGMFGGSYVGATHISRYCAATASGRNFSECDCFDYHDGWTYQGGAFEQWFNESWTSGLVENTVRRRVSGGSHVAWSGRNTLPLTVYSFLEAPSMEGIAPYFADWLAHPDFDQYWKELSIEDHYGQIQVPVFSLERGTTFFLVGLYTTTRLCKRKQGRILRNVDNGCLFI